MAKVRLDVTIDDEKGEQRSAYERLQPAIGIADSGGKHYAENTGKRLRELLEEKRQRTRRSG